MICSICKRQVNYYGLDEPESFTCSTCIRGQYESDMARLRARRIYYNKELVVIGKAEFECSGYYLSGKLYDEEVTMKGNSMVWLLTTEILEQIGNEIIRRIETKVIFKRIEEIEQELPDSKDPATLRLERSDLDSELQALEAKHD